MKSTLQCLPPPGRYAAVQCGCSVTLNTPKGAWQLHAASRTTKPETVIVEVSDSSFEVKPGAVEILTE